MLLGPAWRYMKRVRNLLEAIRPHVGNKDTSKRNAKAREFQKKVQEKNERAYLALSPGCAHIRTARSLAPAQGALLYAFLIVCTLKDALHIYPGGVDLVGV